jgi:hypothetical protein
LRLFTPFYQRVPCRHILTDIGRPFLFAHQFVIIRTPERIAEITADAILALQVSFYLVENGISLVGFYDFQRINQEQERRII